MNFLKKHTLLSTSLAFLLVIVLLNIFMHKKGYSYADLGVTPPTEKDCSLLKNKHAVTPVSLLVSVPQAAPFREKIKTLITKYEGNITNDSFSSYPDYTNASSGNTESFNITVEFKKSQDEFLAELSELIKNSKGTNLSYTYNNNTYDNTSYSPYASCLNSLQMVKNAKLQLEVLTKALRTERNPENISLLSQSVYDTRSVLQNNINTMNSFMTVSDIPSVSISVSPTSQSI